jgi:UDP-glucuronate 4-epimerase
MTILVTGGAGFIGSHLVESLLADGIRVICIDDFNDYYAPALKEKNLSAAMDNSLFTLLRGDIRSAAMLDRACAGRRLDAVVHLAARAGVRPSLQDPILYHDVNVGGTIQVLEACRRHQIPRLVMASSSSVYGDRVKVPFQEEERVDWPISPYAASKKSAELIGHTYHYLYGLSVSCLRFFTVYGPRQRPDMAIHKFARAIVEGREIAVYGDGSTRRDYTFVEDIVAGIRGAVTAEYGYEVFNLGNSETVSLAYLIDVLEGALGRKARRRHEPEQPGDVPITSADVTKAREMLGYCPRVAIEEGLSRFAAWLLAGSSEQGVAAEAARGSATRSRSHSVPGPVNDPALATTPLSLG